MDTGSPRAGGCRRVRSLQLRRPQSHQHTNSCPNDCQSPAFLSSPCLTRHAATPTRRATGWRQPPLVLTLDSVDSRTAAAIGSSTADPPDEALSLTARPIQALQTLKSSDAGHAVQPTTTRHPWCVPRLACACHTPLALILHGKELVLGEYRRIHRDVK